LPSGGLPRGHGSDTIAFANERPGTRDHHLAFGEAFANLGLSGGEQTNADPPGLNPVITDHLNDGAARSVQNG
jgi:hypothetical protein